MPTSPTLRTRLRVALATTLLTCAAACGGGGDTTAPPSNIPTAIAVAPATVTLTGLSTQAAIAATLAPAGVSAAVSWTSDNPAIATVSGTGLSATVTAVGSGTTRIVARTGALESASTVTVVPIVRRVILPADTLRLTTGGTQTLAPTFDADAGSNTAVTWSTSAAGISLVSTSGVVTGVAPGVAVVTATSVAFPTLSASTPVRVTLPAVAVAITPANPTIVAGATRQLAATVTAAEGVATTVTWGTTAPLIATVSTSGLVSALAPGTANITATSTANPTVTATTTVTVSAPTVRAIALAPSIATIGPAGTRQLVATIDADAGANTGLDWVSSNSAIATVSSSGLVTGVALGGPVTITARSQLVSAVVGTAQITVSPPPPSTQFVLGRIGTGSALGGIGGWSVWSANATDGIVGLGFQFPGFGDYQNALLVRNAAGWRDVSPACCGNAGLPDVFGTSATNMLVVYFGNSVRSIPARAFRWNGSALTDVPFPPALAGVTDNAIGSLVPTGIDEYFLLRPSGVLYRYTAGAWTRLDSLSTGTTTQTFSRPAAWHRDTLVALSCPGGSNNRMVRWTPGRQVVVPLPTESCSTLSGTAGNALAYNTPTSLATWDGLLWSEISSGRVPADTFASSATCGDERYVGARSGAVYRRSGSALVRIASDGEVMAQSEYSVPARLHCAADGTLRIISGDGLIVRRTGNTWTEENYAPNHTRVQLASATTGFLVGNGVVHRWNGAQWQRIRRVYELGERYVSLAAFGNGGMIAGGATRRSIAVALRFDGSTFALDTLTEFRSVSSLAAIGDNKALAVVTPNSLQPNSVLRYNNGWTNLGPVVANPIAVSASSATNAFVVGGNGEVRRYDGATFTLVASLPFSNATGVALHTLSATQAFAGECTNFPGGNRIWRFTGAAWIDITPVVAGGISCVNDLFGTGASDMYAILRSPVAGSPYRLLRWDGATWSPVAGVPDSQELRVGSAVAGLTFLAGSTGYLGTGTPPAALRRVP